VTLLCDINFVGNNHVATFPIIDNLLRLHIIQLLILLISLCTYG